MEAAHRHRWQIFEVVFGVPFLIAIALQLIVPLSLPRGPLRPVLILAGVTCIVAGVAAVTLARGELRGQAQPTDPGQPTTKIVTTGVYSISRNPLYLGGALIVAGTSLAGNLPWALLLLPVALVACHYFLIRPEEKYLAAQFGPEYGAYAASVHRWFGRVRREVRR